jgi:hypothetical protein
MKLRCVLLLFTFFLWVPVSSGEEVKRLENETLENFARRNGPPQSELAHGVVETEAWGHQKTVIAFYAIEVKDKYGTHGQVDGYLFLPLSPNTYHKILIENFEPEGGDPKIEAAFFANADKDAAKELIVICSWPQEHYDFSGRLYGTFVFDDLRPGTNPTKLNFLEGVSEKVSGSCDCTYRDGKRKTSKYKTATSVKIGLKKLGF